MEEMKIPGMIRKSARIEAGAVTEAELKLINKYALHPLTAEEVFTFKAVLCDNEIDRDFERFTAKALRDLQKLYLGKTVIKDHAPRSDNQIARIYATEVVDGGRQLKSGEQYMQLVAHCYMVKTAGNADLIAEIRGGIKREGSVSCSVSSAICSICGTDNRKSYCRHYPGRNYEKEHGTETCIYTLSGAKDAYEFSLVAVPAQKAAGVKKSYMGDPIYEEAPEETQKGKEDSAEELLLRVKITELLTKIHKED